jgi:uncharacterized protein YbjT (DUF2867 family)
MTTLVTGATGKVGGRLVAELLDRGIDVRALSRQPAPALPAAVSVIEGSLDSVPDGAFDGIDSVFLFPADADAEGFVDRAVAAGVSRFVVLSSLAVSQHNARDVDSASATHHAAIERAVTDRTADWTILRPGNFANNLLFWAFPIRSGYPVRMPYPTSSQTVIHEADVALAAAIALTEPGHEGRVYELTGPRGLTRIEHLAAISAAIGRDVPFVEVTAEEFRADSAQYMDQGVIDMLLRYWSETVDAPEVPLALPLGITLTSLDQWANDHRSDFGG